MKIAVVGPSPVPFTIGGAENLLWSLCDAINQKTPHQAELIKLPSKELAFWDLIGNYHQFYHLDLDHFDAVIVTKYPSWMVQHRRKICYMIHTLRGLYDTYHLTNLPKEVKRGNPEIDRVMDYMSDNPRPVTLEPFFQMMFRLKGRAASIPQEYFMFPGPLIRQILHYLDHAALSQAKPIYSISNTVRDRTEYYPEGARVTAVHHPSALKEFRTGGYEYVFMISRLDAPKRIDMLIRAMKYVKSDVRLLIAGTGPQESALKEMAQGDGRIRFLGFVNDDEVEDYYSNSLVIPYFPYDEDYGLITIEAMMHKKPVITTTDAGGPNEFVVNQETGFVTKFDAKAIAEKIDYFAENPQEAERMGDNAYQKVKDITWENTVNKILESLNAPSGRREPAAKGCGPAFQEDGRKKITVTSTFPIYPPQGGGQARIFNLYKNVAEQYNVEIVSFTGSDQRAFNAHIAKGVREIRVPKSDAHQRKEWEIEKKVGIPVTDIAMLSLSGETPAYGKALQDSIASSEWVVLSHPYLYDEAKKYLKGKKIIYEAHNVESAMKKAMLPDTSYAKSLIDLVFQAEQACCADSELIMACSAEDRETLCRLYGVDEGKIIVVPNGVDCSATPFTPVEQRAANKAELGLDRQKVGLFMGSWHGPNLEACEKIFEIAAQCPETTFLLMGSQCGYFKSRKLPVNVGLLGVVSEETKYRVFSAVDFALNPMLSGSGTNLKMFDYMAAGIPVITTAFGMRGIGDRKIVTIAEPAEMAAAIRDFRLADWAEKTEAARKYVEETFDWSVISKILLNRLSATIKGN